jgi:RNA polymerase sigma-70 factor (ECF subfamily)
LARRDPEAFAVFYRRHVGSIVGFFVRRTACQETAADLTAETFAQAYLSRHRYHPTGAPARAWLAAIARHQLAHFVRAAEVANRARRRLGMRPVPAGDEPFEQLIESFDARRGGAALRIAMAGLTDGVADAVRFRVIDELAYADVAARLGCTEAAARQRVARGLSHLSEALEVDR